MSRPRAWWIDEQAVQQFQRKRPVNLVSVVPIPFDMAPHHCFECILFPVGSGERARVEQYFLHVSGKNIAIPNAEMVVLMPAKEKAFQVKRSQEMIDLRYPLRHPVIVSVFRLKGKIVVMVKNGARKSFTSAG